MLSSLIPNPLHPAVVHLPLAFAVIAPLFALGALWFIRKGARPRVAWGVTVGLLAAMAASAWVSVETGEDQEERVEDVIAEGKLGPHEDAANTFLIGSAVVLLIAAAGLAGGNIGKAGRVVGTLGTVALVAGALRVGHSGGMLVYRDGAASAYASAVGATGAAGERGEKGEGNVEMKAGEVLPRGESAEKKRGGDDDDDDRRR